MLPPFNGGLHCGEPGQRRPSGGHGCSRLSTAGSIAAGVCRCIGGHRLPACSRLSTAGSIAASGTAAGHRHCAGVLPPFNGGLHCGPLVTCQASRRIRGCSRLSTAGSIAACRASRRSRCIRRAPAYQRRAPLRRRSAVRPWSARPGAPAFQRRAPLRPPAGAGAVRTAAVLPPFNGGLHCGTLSTASVADRAAACSRLSTAGSIAASTTAAALQHGSPVLPPFNGGLHCGTRSAHASGRRRHVLPPFNGGLHCGMPCRPGTGRQHDRAPAFQRRAPLRQRSAGTGNPGVARCSRLSTAGSIAARARRLHRRPGDPVLPPFNGGLHCGARAGTSRAQACVLPPFNGGLHCGALTAVGSSEWTPTSAPAFQRRAPLRPASPRQSGYGRGVLPPFNGGLHCGRIAAPSLRPRPRCSRLSTAGSIAANGRLRRRTGGLTRAPAFQRRAPLRLRYARGPEPRPGRCSRLSTAGSIAAAATYHRTR